MLMPALLHKGVTYRERFLRSLTIRGVIRFGRPGASQKRQSRPRGKGVGSANFQQLLLFRSYCYFLRRSTRPSRPRPRRPMVAGSGMTFWPWFSTVPLIEPASEVVKTGCETTPA